MTGLYDLEARRSADLQVCAWADRLKCLPLLVALAIVGCGSGHKLPAESSSPRSAAPSASAEPNQALREELRSGLFQLSATLDSIQEALKQAKDIQKGSKDRLKEAMADIVDHIDSCGATLADHNDEPPTVEEVAKAFAKYDDRRLKAIEDVNDTLTDLKITKGMVAGLTGDTPELEDKLVRLAALIDQAMEDAIGTLQALGGQEQQPAAAPPN